jgi:hypothetical protein
MPLGMPSLAVSGIASHLQALFTAGAMMGSAALGALLWQLLTLCTVKLPADEETQRKRQLPNRATTDRAAGSVQ